MRRFLTVLRQGRSPWGPLDLATEWDYQAGRTDVLARTCQRSLIAFEAKLRDWKKASLQAYRNTTYAHHAYVVMPIKQAARVAVEPELFARYGIGLCGVHGDTVEVLIEGQARDAILPWVTERAQGFFDGRRHGRSRANRPSSSPRVMHEA